MSPLDKINQLAKKLKVKIVPWDVTTRGDKDKSSGYVLDTSDNIIELHLKNAGLQEFPPENFKGADVFGHIQKLDLSGNPLQKITLNADFDKLQFLNILGAKQDSSKETSSSRKAALKITARLPKLQYLFATRCQLESVEIIGDCPQLELLELKDNNISLLYLHPDLCRRLVKPDSQENVKQMAEQLPLRLFGFFEKKDGKWVPRQQMSDVLAPKIENLYSKGNQSFLVEYMSELSASYPVETSGQTQTVSQQPQKSVLKLILLGNTGAGKTLLGDDLIRAPAKKPRIAGDSTHGIQWDKFELTSDSGQKVEVYCYDFGGQDYYHNTHYPFFGQRQVLYVVLWADKQKQYTLDWEDRVIDQSKPNVTRREQTYPLSYWLGSVQKFVPYLESEQDAKASLAIRVNIAKNYYQQQNNIQLLLLENRFTHNEAQDLDLKSLKSTYPYLVKALSDQPTQIELWNGVNFTYTVRWRWWSVWSKFGKYFTFHQDVLNSLKRQIVEQAAPVAVTQPILNLENEIKSLVANGDVLCERSEIERYLNPQNDKEIDALNTLFYDAKKSYLFEYVLDEGEAKDDLKRLQQDYPVLCQYVVLQPDRLSQWIYAVLNQEAINSGDGYFSREDIKKRLKAKKFSLNDDEFLYLIEYMLNYDIVFKAPHFVKGGEYERYFAPNLLPEPTGRAAELLLAHGFGPAVVKYQFKTFFHSSVLSKIISEFHAHLVETQDPDPNKPRDIKADSLRYELWKNTLILVEDKNLAKVKVLSERSNQTVKNETVEMPLLLIDFAEETDCGVVKVVPVAEIEKTLKESTKKDEEDSANDPTPKKQDELADEPVFATLRLRLYLSKSISSDFIQKIMVFIEKEIDGYHYSKYIQSPGGRYIPQDVIKGKLCNEHGQTLPIFNFNNTLYRRGDFLEYLTYDKGEKPIEFPMKKLF